MEPRISSLSIEAERLFLFGMSQNKGHFSIQAWQKEEVACGREAPTETGLALMQEIRAAGLMTHADHVTALGDWAFRHYNDEVDLLRRAL